MADDAPPALGDVERVVNHHRRRLLAHADQHSDNPHFAAGLAWGLYALERVDRALRGITDRSALGLVDEPHRPPQPLPPLPLTTPARKDPA